MKGRSAATLLTLSFILLLVPSLASAATFAEKRTLVLSQTPPDNVYLAGVNVTVSSPLPSDLSAVGAAVHVFAPIGGDALVAGGTVDLQQPVAGDVRAIGGTVTTGGDVSGDVVVAGGTVTVTGKAYDLRLFGANVQVTGGASGPVKIYGADVTLSGDYTGDVEVIASDRFTIGNGTHIHGALRYNAPQQIDVPATATIDGTTTYTGSYSYVPTNAEAQKFAIAGAGIFYIVRALSVMIAAALVAGLFPEFSFTIADRIMRKRPRSVGLRGLLGFGILVAAPVLIIFLLLSFVGAALALLLGSLYFLLAFLSYLISGIVLGGMLRQALARGETVFAISWKDAALGMLGFFVLGSLPYIGWIFTIAFACVTLGTIVSTAYSYSFARPTDA
jgi:hypothetical protein